MLPLVFALLLPLFPATAGASGGVAVAPATLSFVDPPLLPGGSSQGVLVFQQQYDEPVKGTIELVARTDAGSSAVSWITLTNAGSRSYAPGDHRVPVHIQVPKTAADGLYQAGVRFAIQPPGAQAPTGSGLSTQAAVTAVIDIRVENGNQVKQVTVSGSPQVFNTEAKRGMQIEVPLSNPGNVDANPHIRLQILDKFQDEVLRTHWFNDTVLRPGESGNYTLVAPALELPQDQYWAIITVYLDGVVVSTSGAQTFDVLEAGELDRLAELRTIRLAGDITRADKGDLVKLTAFVRNTGEVPLEAVFRGEVWRDGKLVDTLESSPLEVPIGQEGGLDMVYRVAEPGRYEFKGRAHYGSKVSEEKSVLLTVDAGPSAVVPFLLVGIVLASAGGAAVVAQRERLARRRR